MWIYLLILATSLLLYYWSKFVKHDPKSNNILERTPGPQGIPLLGSSWQLRSTKQVFNIVHRLYDRFGKTIRINLSIIPTIGTYDYDLIKHVLSTNEILRKSQNYDWVRPWLGTGLVTVDGHDEKWRKHRKMLTPAFHFEMLKTYVRFFDKSGDVLIEKLGRIGNAASVDVNPILKLYTLDVITEAAMGVRIRAQDGKEEHYVNDVERMCRIIIDRAFSVLKLFDSTFFLTIDYYLQKRSLKRLKAFTERVILDRMAERTKRQTNHSNGDVTNRNRKLALLDLLLETRESDSSLSFEDIREEVDTFMFAGHDTTATAISFMLYAIADHPEVQDKLVEEQISLFGRCPNPPEVFHEDLMKMKYLDMVIKETLRLYPPVPLLGRFTSSDVKFGDVSIPRHVNVGLYLYRLHRDPLHFENPEAFVPERFETPEKIAPYAYVPFSAGSRNCIGQKFAMLEMKSTVSKIIRNFRVAPAEPRHELDLTVETVLKSLTGVKVALVKREYN